MKNFVRNVESDDEFYNRKNVTVPASSTSEMHKMNKNMRIKMDKIMNDLEQPLVLKKKLILKK